MLELACLFFAHNWETVDHLKYVLWFPLFSKSCSCGYIDLRCCSGTGFVLTFWSCSGFYDYLCCSCLVSCDFLKRSTSFDIVEFEYILSSIERLINRRSLTISVFNDNVLDCHAGK